MDQNEESMGENECMCVGTQKFKRNSLQQSHFRQKEEEDEFGNEINNGDLKHLLPKKKSHVHKMPH